MATDDVEVRFARSIVKLLTYFNLLDTNVGLCLSHLVSPDNPQASYSRLASQTSQQRFDDLKRFVAKGIGSPTSVDRAEFEKWLIDATRARSIRNRYIHGNWEYLPNRPHAPVGVSAPAWMRDKLGAEAYEAMTLDQLEGIADEIAQIFARFMEIRRRHGI